MYVPQEELNIALESAEVLKEKEELAAERVQGEVVQQHWTWTPHATQLAIVMNELE